MKLKPKQTVKNPKALIYRRFTHIETSVGSVDGVYYKTPDNYYWQFNLETENFETVNSANISEYAKIINITNVTINNTQTTKPVLQYKTKYYTYPTVYPLFQPAQWIITDSTSNPNLLSVRFKDIGKYQTNNYYFAGSFDYMIKGQQEGGTTQYIKGNIIPLTSMNIKYYSDTANLQVDDLVVIGKHLFSVENPETTFKQQPKPYKIYYVTLNSIL